MNSTVLTKENYHSFKDLTIFPCEQLIKFFLTIPKAKTLEILRSFENDFLKKLMDQAPKYIADQWRLSLNYKAGTVGELMQPSPLIVNENMTIEDVITEIQKIPKQVLFTYGMVVDDKGNLSGVLVFRDIFYHNKTDLIRDVFFKKPIFFRHDEDILDIFVNIAGKQIPEYPVVDENGKLLGVLRGSHVADAHALEISAQSGFLVGLSKEESIETPFMRCIQLRSPWLLVNLATAFVAGAVVGVFQDTIDKLVLLAMFLPVLAGQSGNTGAQALAVLIREMTIGVIGPKLKKQLVKEAILGVVHGFMVGVICLVVMYFIATTQNNPHAIALSIIILVAMTSSCLISGLIGAFVPVALKRLGFDPAAGSSIILTTGTDVVSMGVMLFLANKFILEGL